VQSPAPCSFFGPSFERDVPRYIDKWFVACDAIRTAELPSGKQNVGETILYTHAASVDQRLDVCIQIPWLVPARVYV
jgi:hypothetical protein